MTQKIKYVSDIHLEFSAFPVSEDFDKEVGLEKDVKDTILLVAGDTVLSSHLIPIRTDGSAKTMKFRFERFLSAVKRYKKVYMIAGNHEAYSYGDVTRNKEYVSKYLADNGYDNVQFLEDERIPLTKKTDLLASTLWTDFNKGNPMTLHTVNGMMNDFRVSFFKDNFLTTQDAYEMHKASLKWLKNELLDTSKSFVVMTHHLPSFQSINPTFKGDVMNYGYASDLDDMILQHQHITHWIHGHTHFNTDYMIGSTNVLSHQRGYPQEVSFDRSSNWKGFKLSAEFSVA